MSILEYKDRRFKVVPYKEDDIDGIWAVWIINQLDPRKDTKEMFLLCDETQIDTQGKLELVMDGMLKEIDERGFRSDYVFSSKPEHSPVHSYAM